MIEGSAAPTPAEVVAFWRAAGPERWFKKDAAFDDDIRRRFLALYKAAGDADGLKWAEIHADIIRRFGRFPHRNAALGRVTTPEEQAFLDSGGFAG